jgi:hypothetical protein
MARRNHGHCEGYQTTSPAILITLNPPTIMKSLPTSLLIAGGLALATLPAFAGDGEDKFKLMDTNGDGSVSRAEHAAGAQTMFGKMDADSNGIVTTAEMEAGHTEKKSSKLKFWEKNDKSQMSAADKISQIDSNADGQITRAEHEAGSEKMFTKLDTNDDGTLSKDECEAGHKGMKKDN